MKTTAMLCDYAVVADGKLFISGGGISIVSGQAASMCLALILHVPWTDTNRRIASQVRLIDEDGVTVQTDDGPPVDFTGELEVGRPVGAESGTAIDVPQVFRVNGLPLGPGRYRWEVNVDNVPSASVPFSMRHGE